MNLSKVDEEFSEHRLLFYAVSVTLLPSLLLVGLISQVSPLCPRVLHALSSVPKIASIEVYVVLLLVVCLYVLLLWNSDWRSWPMARRWVAWWLGFVLAYSAAWLAVPHAPCFAVASLGLTGLALLYALRKLCFPVGVVPSRTWYKAATIAVFLSAFVCLVIWFVWLAFGFGGREKWTDWSGEMRALVSNRAITWKMAFVSWIAPFALFFQQTFLGALILMRKRHADFVDLDQTQPDYVPEKEAFLIHSMQQIAVAVAAAVMTSWITASINATGDIEFNQEREDMRDEVLALSFWACVGLALSLIQIMDWDEVEKVVKQKPAVQEAEKLLTSDWMRAMLLLAFALPMSLTAVVDIFRRHCCGVVKEPALSFTRGKTRWAGNCPWEWTSIVVKALWLGVIYVSLEVGCMKAITVLLAYVNGRLAVWPLWTVSFLMFLIAWFIFMLPPAPGPPVYMLMGIVITSSAMNSGWSFWGAVAWATFLAFAMKLVFTASAMWLVGRPLSQNMTVRRWIGINQPYMRAVEILLGGGEHGNKHVSLAKVSLLIGGPDWPVAVLCGVLKVDTWLVLLCVSPVLLQSVFPCVLAGSLMLYNGPGAGSNQHMGGLAELCLLFMAGLQILAFLVAGYYIQEVMERKHEKITKMIREGQLPGELQEEELAKERERSFERDTKWELLPGYVQISLAMGLMLMEASIILFLLPWRKIVGGSCFKDITLSTSVEKDLQGNPLNVVNPLGWGALVIFALSMLCLAMFYAWAQTATKSERTAQESSRLVSRIDTAQDSARLASATYPVSVPMRGSQHVSYSATREV